MLGVFRDSGESPDPNDFMSPAENTANRSILRCFRAEHESGFFFCPLDGGNAAIQTQSEVKQKYAKRKSPE